MRHAQILSTGSYVPERVVTNAEIDEILGEPTSDWLIENVGIRERRWMTPDQTTSDLVVEASRRALERAGIRPEDLDLLISPPIPRTISLRAPRWWSSINWGRSTRAAGTSTAPAQAG
jgi:3-oxoacyl-[acyl-carrier-protein] synthase III